MKFRSKSSSKALQVVLGSQTIKAFVAAPKEFKVIGIVRMGMEFGLLAITATGHYVRVNGSVIESLEFRAVEAAIRVVRATGRGESYAATRMHRDKGRAAAVAVPPPVVVHKRRRQIADIPRAAVYAEALRAAA